MALIMGSITWGHRIPLRLFEHGMASRYELDLINSVYWYVIKQDFRLVIPVITGYN